MMLLLKIILCFHVLSLAHGQSIEDLITKVFLPGSPKGSGFSTIKGPQCNSSRIGIVGAGPSGVHMAYSLKKMGFTDVTLLERSDRIGGKGEHVEYRDMLHPLTILLWASDYNDTLVPLLEEFGLLDFGSTDVKDKGYLWTGSNDSSPLLSATQYVVGYAMQTLSISDPNLAMARVVQDISKYDDIHRDFFGVYPYGLPQPPSDNVLEQISGSILDFLTNNDLVSLVPLFQNSFHTNGFG